MLTALVLVAWPHVDLDVTLAEDHVLRGRAAWRYVNTGPAALTEVQFNLVANAGAQPNPHLSGGANAAGHWNAWSPSATEVVAVRGPEGGELRWRYADAPPATQTWGLERGVLVVALGAPLPPGASALVEVTFATRIPHRRGDAGRFNGDSTWRFGWFPQPRHRDGDGGWSDAAYLTAFTHRTRFSVDDDDATVVLGAQGGAARAGGTSEVWSEVPVRSIPFVVSDRLETIEAEVEGVKVRVHYYPDAAILDTSRGEAEATLRRLRRVLKYFNAHYGRYRFGRLEVLESPTTYLSMAGDGLLLLGDLFFVHDRTWLAWGLYEPIAEVVLAHELAHQWWGLGLGVAFDRDNWLSEGLSQMLALGYAEARMGDEDLLDPNFFLRWMLAAFANAAWPTNTLEHAILPAYEDHVRFGLEEPLVLPDRDVRHLEETAYRLYEKGYLAARAMRSLLGAKDTDRVLREVYARKAGARVTVEDLREVARDVAGVDLGPLLDGFVLGDARVDLQIVGVEGRAVRLHREGDLALPAVVEARGAGGRRKRFDWPADARDLTLALKFEPTSVEVDPDAWVPDTDRSNNVWPGDAAFDFLAAKPDTRRHRWSFNPMPLHRYYLVGLSFGGRTANEWVWGTGGGLLRFGPGTDPAEEERAARAGEEAVASTVINSLVYAESAWTYDRARAVGVAAVADLWTFDDRLAHQGGQLTVSHVWGLFERTDVGQVGALWLPRTFLTTAIGVDAGQHLAEDTGVPEDYDLEEGVGGLLVLGVLRNERVNYGFDVGLTLTGGTSRAQQDPYGVGRLAIGYGFVVPYLGQVELQTVAGAITRGGPGASRPALAQLAATVKTTAPYEASGQAAMVLRLPILRERRVKNALTLGLLVFDDLSLDLGYAAAHGLTYDDGFGDPLGQVSAALALGIGAFPGKLGDLIVGVALPTWPAPTEPDAWQLFLGAGFGVGPSLSPAAAPGRPLRP